MTNNTPLEEIAERLTKAQQKLIRDCVQWAFDSVGEGFIVPEEAFWEYSQATGDEDWETLADRISDLALRNHLQQEAEELP